MARPNAHNFTTIPTGLRLVLGNMVAILVLLVIGEVIARTFVAAGSEESFLNASRDLLAPCIRTEQIDGTTLLSAQEKPERLAFSYPRTKSPDTLRIAVVGESTGSLLGWHMQRRANDPNYPKTSSTVGPSSLELLNCAEPGSALEHVVRRADEVLNYEPDVLVVVFGHNIDFEYPIRTRDLAFLWLRAKSRLVASLLRKQSPKKRESPEQRNRHFESWLNELADKTAAANIQLVLTTMTPNLWMPPYESARAREHPAYLEAQHRYLTGDRGGAIDALEAAIEIQPEPAWHFTSARWLVRSGEAETAKEHLRIALDASSARLSHARPLGRDRAGTAVNAMLRRFAKNRSVTLRDTERAVEEMSFLGIPGWGPMEDHCHLHKDLMKDEASVLLQVAQNAAGASAKHDAGSPMASNTLLTSYESLSAHNDPAAYKNLARLEHVLTVISRNAFHTGWTGKALSTAVELWARQDVEVTREAVARYRADPEFQTFGGPRREAELLSGIADGFWQAGFRDHALALIQEASTDDAGIEPWLTRGKFEIEAGNLGKAREALDKALSLMPDAADVLFFRKAVGD